MSIQKTMRVHGNVFAIHKLFLSNKLSTKLSIPTIKYLASLSSKGPTGKFFWFMNEIDIFPDLSHINCGKPKILKKNDN